MHKLLIAIVLISSFVYASDATTTEAPTLDSLASALKILMDDHNELKEVLLGTTTRLPKQLHPIKKVAGTIGNVARFAFNNLANTAVAAFIFHAMFENMQEENFFRNYPF